MKKKLKKTKKNWVNNFVDYIDDKFPTYYGYLNEYKIGRKVIVTRGYYQDKTSKIFDYSPFRVIDPGGLFKNSSYEPDAFLLKIDKKNIWFPIGKLALFKKDR